MSSDFKLAHCKTCNCSPKSNQFFTLKVIMGNIKHYRGWMEMYDGIPKFDFKSQEQSSGMGVMRRFTPLPLPDPWGLPAPTQSPTRMRPIYKNFLNFECKIVP